MTLKGVQAELVLLSRTVLERGMSCKRGTYV